MINGNEIALPEGYSSMKKFLVVAIVIVLVGLGGVFAGDHYRYELYDAAIAFEQDRAGLKSQTGLAGPNKFAYIETERVEGQESIIMLHGFSANKTNWIRLAQHLGSQYHLVALDLLGHGDNEQDMSRSYSIVEQVEFVKLAAAGLGIARFHLVGNSMGGAISALYSATYPEQVITATLISPAGVHDIPSVMDDIIKDGENPLIATTIEEFGRVIDFVMVEKPYIPGPVQKVEAERSVARIEINRKIFKDIRADLDTGLQQGFASISAPVLFIWGDQDRAINVKNIDRYASLIPNAQKKVYEDIGHLAMIEVPQRTARDILDFIASN